MTTYTLFSDAARDTALDAVGGEMMGTQDTELLKQIFVAAGNATGTGGNPFDQSLNTTNNVQFANVDVQSSVDGEVLTVNGNAAGGGDTAIVLRNNTGNGANIYAINQAADSIGIGVVSNHAFIVSSLPISFILPTSSVNLPSGSVWNDAGVVSIVP